MHESRVAENSVRRETIYLKIIAQSNLCREADVHLGWRGGGVLGMVDVGRSPDGDTIPGCTSTSDMLFITR